MGSRGITKRMNISIMRNLLEKYNGTNAFIYLSKNFGIFRNVTNFFKQIAVNGDKNPFFVEDYRFGFFEKGEINATFNLKNYHEIAPKLVFIKKGTIGQINSISDDMSLMGLVVSDEFMQKIVKDYKIEQVIDSFQSFLVDCSEDDSKFYYSISDCIWKVAHSKVVNDSVIESLFLSVINYYSDIYKRQELNIFDNNSCDRKLLIFNDFISLLNKYVETERSLTFYSSKLFLSPRYLSSLIKEQSGESAKYWIDQALVQRIKVMLKQTTMTVSQISSSLNFPNDSFFCKYFHRLVGFTPSEYRNQN